MRRQTGILNLIVIERQLCQAVLAEPTSGRLKQRQAGV
jgi:hypothetical protein